MLRVKHVLRVFGEKSEPANQPLTARERLPRRWTKATSPPRQDSTNRGSLASKSGKLGSWLDISMVEVPLCSGRLMGFIFLAQNHLLTRSTTLCAASQQNESVDVRFGSLAAAAPSKWNVRFTPESCRGCRRPARQLWAKSGLLQCSKSSLFDHLVGSYDQVLWDCETKRLGGLPIDDEIEFRRPLDRQVRRLSPLEDLVDKKRASIPEIRKIHSVSDDGSRLCELRRTDQRNSL